MNDELQDRLRRADPLPTGVPVVHITGGDAHGLLEEIMDNEDTQDSPRRGALIAAALVGIAATVLLVALLAGGADDPSTPETSAVASAPLELTGADPTVMLSCMMLDATTAADVELAFRATVASSEGELAVLDVDEWYKGGDATQVEITSPQWEGMSVDDVDFEVGESYLVSANDGVVNACFTQVLTPEGQTLFEDAFGVS